MKKVTLEAFDPERDSGKLLGWLSQPHVARWWGDPVRAMQQARQCAPGSQVLIAADGDPVGYMCWQMPPLAELEAASLADLPKDLVDIDLMIGKPDLLGHGIGSRALGLLLRRLQQEPSFAFAGLGTSSSNRNAIRCFEKAGFRPFREFEDPEWGPCIYLVADLQGDA